MSKKNKNKKSKFGLFAALAAIAGVGIYLFTKDSEKETATQKPEWWYFAHPQKKYEEISNDEIEDLFEKIFIPETGYTTCDGPQYVNVENPGTVKSIIYIPTGEVITDIDNSFFSKLITYHDEINYGFKNINGNSVFGITELTKEEEAKTAADLAAEEAAEEAAKEAAKEAAEEAEEAASSPALEIVPDYDEEEALAILTTSNSADNLRSNDVYLNILKYYSIPRFKVIYPSLFTYESKLDPNRFDEIPYSRNRIEIPYIVDNKTLTLIPKEHFNSDFFNVFYDNIYNYNHGNLIDTVKITLADGRQGYVYTARKMYNKSPYFQYVIALRDAEKAAEKAKEEAAKTEEQKAKEAAEKAEEERKLIEAFKTAFEKNIIL